MDASFTGLSKCRYTRFLNQVGAIIPTPYSDNIEYGGRTLARGLEVQDSDALRTHIILEGPNNCMNSVAIRLEMTLTLDYDVSLTNAATLCAAIVGNLLEAVADNLLEAIGVNDTASRPVPRGMRHHTRCCHGDRYRMIEELCQPPRHKTTGYYFRAYGSSVQASLPRRSPTSTVFANPRSI